MLEMSHLHGTTAGGMGHSCTWAIDDAGCLFLGRWSYTEKAPAMQMCGVNDGMIRNNRVKLYYLVHICNPHQRGNVSTYDPSELPPDYPSKAQRWDRDKKVH